jgi:hypothetical protein
MKQEKIDKYRALAQEHAGKHKSAAIIIELLDEIERLQTKDRFRPQKALADEDACPIGRQYKGEKMIDVPADYLLWWWDNGGYNREAIELDAKFSGFALKAQAKQKLRVHDYLRQPRVWHRLMDACPDWPIKHVPNGS